MESFLSLSFQGIALGFTATASPGPFQAFLLNQTITHGKSKTIPLCLAPLLSDAPIVILMLCILTGLPDGFLRFIQIGGGCFLLYLAAGTLSAAWSNKTAKPITHKPRSFFHAILMNLLSPGAYIFWGTITGPMFLKALSRSPLHAACFVGSFYATLITGFVVFVTASSAALSLGRHSGKILAAISGIALIGFGMWQIGKGLAM